MKCAGLCMLIASWLGQHGYDQPHRQAMLRNIEIESRFNPDAISRSGSRCLFQWNGERRQRVLSGSLKCPAWKTQLAFADAELRAVAAYSCFWKARTEIAALSALRHGFSHGHCR
jgi:hypothetical protein